MRKYTATTNLLNTDVNCGHAHASMHDAYICGENIFPGVAVYIATVKEDEKVNHDR